MENFSFYKIVNSGEAGFYYSLNKYILIEKYNLDNPELIKNGVIKTDEEVAKPIRVTDRERGNSKNFTEKDVVQYQKRMFKCAGLPQELIGTHEFQKQLEVAYIKYKAEDLESSITRNLKQIEKLQNENLKLSAELEGLKNTYGFLSSEDREK